MPKYKLHNTESRDDGSGEIAWDIEALSDEGVIIPGRHQTILTPADETQVALDGPNVGAKLISLLKKYAPDDWGDDKLDELAANNALALQVDVNLDIFIDGIGGYPKVFDA